MGEVGDYWREHRDHQRAQRDIEPGQISGVRHTCGGAVLDVSLLLNEDSCACDLYDADTRKCARCRMVWHRSDDQRHMTGPRMGQKEASR